MARLDARWLNFSARGQVWDHFWQDAALTIAPPIIPVEESVEVGGGGGGVGYVRGGFKGQRARVKARRAADGDDFFMIFTPPRRG